MSEAAIRIENLRFAYPRMDEPLLRDISLVIEHGEFVIITGANGSGKTTLGKCMNGLVPYSTGGVFEGRVEVCGTNTLSKDVSDLALQVGIVFSNPEDQLATPHVKAEVAFGLCNLGISRQTILDRIDVILNRLDIGQLKESLTFNLSLGQKQMIAIASCLVMEPEIPILDDPLSHLNQNTSEKVIEIIKDLKKKGTTVIWISQDMSELFDLADRIVLLEGGRVMFNGSPRAMSQKMDVTGLPVIPPQHLELSHALVRAGMPNELEGPSLDDTVGILKELIAPLGRIKGKKGQGPFERRKEAEPLVRFDHVTFRYPNGFLALREIDLSFHPGDFVLLTGWNGSGKTTLAKHMNGLLRPTAGAVLIEGEDIAGKATSDLARDVGFLFQNPDHQLHKSTVRQELAFSLENFGIPEHGIRERILKISEEFDLASLLDRSPQELSGSEKKKVTVASVLIYNPKVVVFDEATANLDRNQTKTIIDIIERYLDENRIVISISHDIRIWADSDRLNRVIIMRDGSVLENGPPETLLCDPDIMGYLCGALLPVTRIARSLSNEGVSPTHYKTRTLVQEIERLWRGSSSATVKR
jgi:energy-coupling factor transport system ATP-binding protein